MRRVDDEKKPGSKPKLGAAAPTPFVSVVVPVYNNAITIAELVRRVGLALTEAGHRYELILVDDRSTDPSLHVAVGLTADDETLGVLGLSTNVGQQRATLAGLRLAAGEWLVVLDADLQDSPEDIPRLLAAAQDGYDIVFARRRVQDRPWHRVVTSRLAKGFLSLITGVPSDIGMFMVLSRRALDLIVKHPISRPWLVGMAALTALPMTTVPVVRRSRDSDRSGYSTRTRLAAGWSAVTLPARWCWSARARRSDHATKVAPGVTVVACAGVCRDRCRKRSL